METVLLPSRNEGDLEDLPEDVRDKMNFVFVDNVDEVFKAALSSSPKKKIRKKKKKKIDFDIEQEEGSNKEDPSVGTSQ